MRVEYYNSNKTHTWAKMYAVSINTGKIINNKKLK